MARTEQIKAELDLARHHDEQARLHRKAAADLLRKSGTRADMSAIAHELGMDSRLVELLIGIG